MNHEQWLYAIKSNKPVRFTEKFLTSLTQIGMDKTEPFKYLGSSMTTKEMHLVECKMVDFLSNKPTLTTSELSVLQSLLWDEKKFSIIEEVKA